MRWNKVSLNTSWDSINYSQMHAFSVTASKRMAEGQRKYLPVSSSHDCFACASTFEYWSECVKRLC